MMSKSHVSENAQFNQKKKESYVHIRNFVAGGVVFQTSAELELPKNPMISVKMYESTPLFCTVLALDSGDLRRIADNLYKVADEAERRMGEFKK